MMFTTYRHAEISFEPVFGDHYQMWQYVEHSQHRPWFYVTLREVRDGMPWDTMLMIPNEEVFESLLEEQSPEMKIASVALVIPGRLNGTDFWSIEQLTELVRIHDKGNEVSGHEFRTVTGSIYLERNQGSSTAETRTRIYLSAE